MSESYPAPRWATHEEMVAHSIGVEEAAWAAIEAAADGFAHVVAQFPHEWRIGDGEGGGVFMAVGKSLAKAGFARDDWEMSAPRRVELLAARDGWICHYCDALLGWGHPSMRTPTMDHVLPKCQGGGNGTDNLVLSCMGCNTRKGTRRLSEWPEWVALPCCDQHQAQYA